jgi:YHS domain-containing protein
MTTSALTPMRRLLALFAASLCFGVASAAPPINTLTGGLFGGRGDVAILGYDPVAYFTDGKPVKGSDKFTYSWQGAKWQFASQQHLEMFRAEPARYAPQYGGYCAYGASQDHLVSIEPEQFTILDGKLYLNYDASVQKTWRKDPAGYNKLADRKYPELLKK